MFRRTTGLLALVSLLSGYAMTVKSASADESNSVFLHAAYLSEPTEWCSANAGVPAVITIDGPDVFVGEFDNAEPARIMVRRGGEAAERVEVGRIGVSDVRVGGVGGSTDTQRLFPRMDEVVFLGRLYVDLEVCQSFETKTAHRGAWRVEAPDGTVARSGEEERYLTGGSHPLFHLYGPYPKAIRLREQTFVVKSQPKIVRTMEAFVSPEEVQTK